MADIKEAGLKLFQFTFPRGERLKRKLSNVLSAFISIHVPTWGTT